ASSQLKIPPDAGDFRLLDRRVVAALNALPERNRFMKGLYAWVGFRTEFLPYTPQARTAGSSSFSARRLIRLALTGV
ncbi:glycosyltransferase, partial [Acinetobacter baumannii]